MRNDTYEILIRCYEKAREGFAIVEDGIVSYSNRALADMADRDICGMRLGDVLPPGVVEKIETAFAERQSEYIECAQVFGKSVDIRVIRYNYEIVLIFTDIDAVAQQMRKNELSFKILKSSHKRLVDAITSVDSAAELMVRSLGADIPESAIDWLKMINSSIGDMSTALMDIVELIESREENADKGCCLEDLSACINRVSEEMSRRFEIKGAKLEVSTEPERIVFPVNIKSVIHMMMRLLDYMSEFAGNGDVLKLCVQAFENHVEIKISDCSGNIPQEHLDFLKDPQIEDMDRIFKLYGNSLYLVRRIALFYDGNMTAENCGSGKVITIKLPRVQVATHVQQNQARLNTNGNKSWWEKI